MKRKVHDSIRVIVEISRGGHRIERHMVGYMSSIVTDMWLPWSGKCLISKALQKESKLPTLNANIHDFVCVIDHGHDLLTQKVIQS